MPHSLEGLANIGMAARLGSEMRDRISAEREVETLAEEKLKVAVSAWHWRLAFRVLNDVFIELAKRHPEDPFFKPTGRRRGNGGAELAYHAIIDRLVAKEAGTMPKWVPRGKTLTKFLSEKF